MSDGGGWIVFLAVVVVLAIIVFGVLGLSGILGSATPSPTPTP